MKGKGYKITWNCYIMRPLKNLTYNLKWPSNTFPSDQIIRDFYTFQTLLV